MRQGPSPRRGRGRNAAGRGKHGPSRNHTYDSNGPDTRIRGTAHQIFDKYVALARDAQSSGDRVAAENYYQHAEHYFRIFNGDLANDANGQEARRQNDPFDATETGESGESGEPEGGRRGDRRNGQQMAVDPDGPQPSVGPDPAAASGESEGETGGRGRGRGRRPGGRGRRPNGDGGESEAGPRAEAEASSGGEDSVGPDVGSSEEVVAES